MNFTTVNVRTNTKRVGLRRRAGSGSDEVGQVTSLALERAKKLKLLFNIGVANVNAFHAYETSREDKRISGVGLP